MPYQDPKQIIPDPIGYGFTTLFSCVHSVAEPLHFDTAPTSALVIVNVVVLAPTPPLAIFNVLIQAPTSALVIVNVVVPAPTPPLAIFNVPIQAPTSALL